MGYTRFINIVFSRKFLATSIVVLVIFYVASLHPYSSVIGGFAFFVVGWIIPSLLNIFATLFIGTYIHTTKWMIRSVLLIFISFIIGINTNLYNWYRFSVASTPTLTTSLPKSRGLWVSGGYVVAKDPEIVIPENFFLPLVTVGGDEGCGCIYWSTNALVPFQDIIGGGRSYARDIGRRIGVYNGNTLSLKYNRSTHTYDVYVVSGLGTVQISDSVPMVKLVKNTDSTAMLYLSVPGAKKSVEEVGIYSKAVDVTNYWLKQTGIVYRALNPDRYGRDASLLNGHFLENNIDMLLHDNFWSVLLGRFVNPANRFFDPYPLLHVPQEEDTDASLPGQASVIAGVDLVVGLAIDTEGSLYTTTRRPATAKTVSKITPSGTVTTFATAGSALGSLVFDTAGNLYAVSYTGYNNAGIAEPRSIIYKITPMGAVSTFATVRFQTGGLAFDTAGNLYAMINNSFPNTKSFSSAPGTIIKIAPSGTVTTFATVGSHPVSPVFDTAGNLYVANSDSGTVSKVSHRGVVALFATVGEDPRELSFDTAGNLYVLGYTLGTISKITPMGAVSTFATGGFQAEGVFDTAGNLYVINDAAPYILRVNSSGAVSNFAVAVATPIVFDSVVGNLYLLDNAGTVYKIPLRQQ